MAIHQRTIRQALAAKTIREFYGRIKNWRGVAACLGISTSMAYQVAKGKRTAGPSVLAAVDVFRRHRREAKELDASSEPEFLWGIKKTVVPFLRGKEGGCHE